MLSDLEETFIQTNGIRLHAVQAGPEEGQLVILLHGFPEFWYGWRKQIGPLAEAGFRVVAPDQRGYNLSDKPNGLSAYRIDRAAADAVGLIGALGSEKAALVGHDWGGVAAWTAAALYPERVEKLVAINAPYPWASSRAILRDPSQLVRSLYVFFFQIPELPEAMLRNNNWELLAEGLRRTSRPGTFTEEDLRQYRQAWWKKGAMTAMLNWYRAFLRRPAPVPWAPRIRPPTLILWGKQDPALSPVNAELSLELCERGRLEFFEEATHWVQHEEAGRVNEELVGFLSV